MVRYRNSAGRVVTRSRPDKWLEASRRWTRVEPLSPIPEPEREQECVAFPPESDDSYDDDGDSGEP